MGGRRLSPRPRRRRATQFACPPLQPWTEDDLREGTTAAAPTAAAPTVEDSVHMERALHNLLQQAAMAALRMTDHDGGAGDESCQLFAE